MEKKKRRRRFVDGECNHVYQRTVNGVNMFYDREDYLIFYMIVSVVSRKYRVDILELCLMVDHVHILLDAESLEIMADFVRDYSSLFVHEYNNSVGRKGQLFFKSYGSAPKKGNKRTRSCIVYIGNNPVEKMLCTRAEEYRWNFLAYIREKNPFSSKILVKKHSRRLVRCMRIADAACKAGCYLSYGQLYRMFSELSFDEIEILTDYIIVRYYPFNEDKLLMYYESYQQMIDAMHSTAGAEYDIKEERYAGSDQVYVDMTALLKNRFELFPVRKVIVLPMEKKLKLAAVLKQETGASSYEVCKFLHLTKAPSPKDTKSDGCR